MWGMLVAAQTAHHARTFGEWFREDGLRILLTLLVAGVATVVARIVVRRFQRKLEAAPSLTQALNLQRVTTLTHALSATAIVAIWTIAALVILGYLDANLAPLLASAGIAGVALGFGAQSIVKDTLSGFFILFENQFGVGDVVEVQTTANPVSGRVESFTLRVTMLRAYDGTLHAVPNGNIQVVSNKTRGWARAIVDVKVGYGEDVDRVRQILEELFEELRTDADFSGAVMDGPIVLGVETMGDYAMVIRVVAETRPRKRFDVERVLRERIPKRLDEQGIKAPMPPAAPRPGPASG